MDGVMLPNEREVWREGKYAVVVARKWYGYGVAVWQGGMIGAERPCTRFGLHRALDHAITRAEQMAHRDCRLDIVAQLASDHYRRYTGA
jgi:hypothetical protein